MAAGAYCQNMRGWSTSFQSLFKGKRGNTVDIAKKKVMRMGRIRAPPGSRRQQKRRKEGRG